MLYFHSLPLTICILPPRRKKQAPFYEQDLFTTSAAISHETKKRKLPFPHRKQLPRHDYHRHIICCKILASPCQKITCKAPLCASHNINSTINFPACQPLSLSFCTIPFLFKVDLCIFTSILPAIFPYINLLFSVNTPSMTSINATIAYIPVKRRHYAVFFCII